MLDYFVQPGKMSMVLDGQFGSTGKGLLSAAIAKHNQIDIAVSNSSPNAGHTWITEDDIKVVTRHLPMAGVISPSTITYLCAGAVVDPTVLLMEIDLLSKTLGADDPKQFLDDLNLRIHERASLISQEDITFEHHLLSGVGSTLSGTGASRAKKLLRVNGSIVEGCEQLKPYASHPVNLARSIELYAARVFMETSQGMGLSVNSGLSFPHSTSHEISVAQALADAQVHPEFLGKVALVFRTHPIRVHGASGPFWPDSQELAWDDMGREPEITTVTKKTRRIATFSFKQFEDALIKARPRLIFMNFMNYIEDHQHRVSFSKKILGARDRNAPKATVLWGYGPKISDIKEDVE